jgi:hypothetical protein
MLLDLIYKDGLMGNKNEVLRECLLRLATIVLKTKPVRWFDQKKPEPMPSPVF